MPLLRLIHCRSKARKRTYYSRGVDPMLLFTKRREQPQERPNNPDVGNQERIVTKGASELWRYGRVPLLITMIKLFISNILALQVKGKSSQHGRGGEYTTILYVVEEEVF